jgi:MSHA biogenesis protein MshJ
MKLSETLASLQTRIDALSLRERGILFLVVALVLYMLWNALLMTPLEKRQKTLLGQINTLRSEITALDQQAVTILERHNRDPNAAERAQLEQLERANAALEQQLKEAISGLIEPQQMAKVLETVLKRQQALHFVRIENLGAEPLLVPQADATQAVTNEAGIYKHSMRLELQGSFADTLAYLRALEGLQWQFRWDEVELTMLDYPTARVVVTVHTLSLQEGWLGV